MLQCQLKPHNLPLQYLHLMAVIDVVILSDRQYYTKTCFSSKIKYVEVISYDVNQRPLNLIHVLLQKTLYFILSNGRLLSKKTGLSLPSVLQKAKVLYRSHWNASCLYYHQVFGAEGLGNLWIQLDSRKLWAKSCSWDKPEKAEDMYVQKSLTA